jgi:WD40 repeat protein
MYFPFSQSQFKDSFKNVSLKTLNGHKKRVYSLDWNQDGTKLASGSVDTTIKVINTQQTFLSKKIKNKN